MVKGIEVSCKIINEEDYEIGQFINDSGENYFVIFPQRGNELTNGNQAKQDSEEGN